MEPTKYRCPSTPHHKTTRLELIVVNDLSTGGNDIEVFWCGECEVTFDACEVLPFNRAIELFPGIQIDRKSEKVTNKLSGDSVWLPPEAVAVYDVIIGAEMCGIHEPMRRGLDWFIEYYPDAYMKLLD